MSNNVLAFVALMLLFLSPKNEVLPYVGYVALLFFLGYGALSAFVRPVMGRGIAKSLSWVSWPLIALLFVMIVAHLKGVLLVGYGFYINDFSEYIKFSFFYLVCVSLYAIVYNWRGEEVHRVIVIVATCYAALFIAYCFHPGFVDFVFANMHKSSRYGGLEYNPNIYAAISNILIVYLVSFFVYSRQVGYLALALVLIASVLMSQSRTGIACLGGALSIVLVISKVKIRYKVIFALLVGCSLFLAFRGLDLAYVQQTNVDNIRENASFLIRLDNSVSVASQYTEEIGWVGIGPAKGVFSDIDMIGYAIYYVRYGVIGVSMLVLFHILAAFYFFRQHRKVVYLNGNVYLKALCMTAFVIPLITMVANISNDKWVDVKYLLLWFFIYFSTMVLLDQNVNERVSR